MRRRKFISLLGGAAAWPLAAHAQEPGRIYRLGFLTGRPRAIREYDAFFDELRGDGFIEGQNLIVDARGFGLRPEQFAEIAAALARSNPDVIFSAGGDPSMHALKAATQTVPIVGGAEDMVASGLVASLSRPGGNITGFSMLSPELDGKRLDILIEAVPSARRMGALADLTQTPQSHIKASQDAARSRGVELSVFGVARSEDIASAIDAAKTSGAQAVNVLAASLLSAKSTSHHRAYGRAAPAGNVPMARNCGGRWLRGLRPSPNPALSPKGANGCQNIARGKTRRHPGRAADPI